MMKVLVVDSSDESRMRVSEALLDLTNLVIVGAVPDVRGATRVLEEGTANVVVTDAELIDGDCLDVIQVANQRDPRPAVVVFAREDLPARGRRCVAAGADLYLPHTAGLRELQSGILDVTAGRRGGRRLAIDDRLHLIGRLAAGVAHDLNNYLSVIDLSLAMLERRIDQPARAELVQARLAMEGATGLTASLLQYVRGGAPAPAPIEVGALIRRVLDRFGRVIPTSVVVTLDVDDPLPPVSAVVSELEQAVLNLIMNACDAMPDGGALCISVQAECGGVRLEVADTGGGLDPDLALAAGPVSHSRKRDSGAQGLGLGIVRAVVDRHGGVLRIVPRSGGGTRVSIAFLP